MQADSGDGRRGSGRPAALSAFAVYAELAFILCGCAVNYNHRKR